MASFDVLGNRSTPLTSYGSFVVANSQPKRIIYDDTLLPYFLAKNGGNPRSYRQFLLENKIGSIFDLEPGEQVQIQQTDSSRSFLTHLEA